jgi:hypothetical protein
VIDHGRRRIIHFSYYNAERVHMQLRDAPVSRPTETRSSPDAKVVGPPRLGGLHHRPLDTSPDGADPLSAEYGSVSSSAGSTGTSKRSLGLPCRPLEELV